MLYIVVILFLKLIDFVLFFVLNLFVHLGRHVEEIEIMKKDTIILSRKNSELDCENAKLNMRLCELRRVIKGNLQQTKQLRNQIETNQSFTTDTSDLSTGVFKPESESEIGSSLDDDDDENGDDRYV